MCGFRVAGWCRVVHARVNRVFVVRSCDSLLAHRLGIVDDFIA